MEEAATQAGDHDADYGPAVVLCKSQANVAKTVDGQSGCQKLLAAQPIRQRAHSVAGQEVGEHHQGEKECGVLDALERQVTLDQQIQRHERDVINMCERMQ